MKSDSGFDCCSFYNVLVKNSQFFVLDNQKQLCIMIAKLKIEICMYYKENIINLVVSIDVCMIRIPL